MSQTTNSIVMDDNQFTLQALEDSIKATGIDRWLTIEVAAVYANVNPMTIKKLVDKGFYVVDDTKYTVQVNRQPGMKPKISALSLIDYMKNGYNRKGFRGARNTPTKTFFVRMPRELIPELTQYLKDRNCVIIDPSDNQRRYLKQRRERLASLKAVKSESDSNTSQE